MNRAKRVSLLDQNTDLIRLIRLGHERGVNQLVEWADGYPTGSTGTTSTISPEGDDGDPLDYNDRTGTLAAAHADHGHDTAIYALHEFDRLLALSNEILETAYQHLRVGLVEQRPGPIGPACKSCRRINEAHTQRPLLIPAYRGELCRFCTDWQRTHGVWPAEQLLRAHHRGERITERMIRKYSRRSA